jgi:6-phosphogluconolactonase
VSNYRIMYWSRREIIAAPVFAATSAHAAEGELLTLVGTYTREDSKGIYSMRFDPSSGKLTPPQLAVETQNPSFLALHPNGRFLYACGEAGEGTVNSFAIDKAAARLKLINSRPSKGSSPCHLVVDSTERNLLVVNYGTGSTIVYRVNADGSLGEETAFVQHTGSSVNERRQKGPHAHSVNLSKNNRYAVVADLGTDEFIVYAFDAAKGSLARHSAAKVKGGSGPRHFSFHPTYRFAYGLNEMGSSVTAFRWSEDRGQLDEIATATTLPSGFAGENNCAEILVHPSGKFVYASNRGHNSIAVFECNPETGTVKLVDHTPTQGEIPRNFRLTPDGKWLLAANQNSANVVVFGVNAGSGKLTPNGQTARVAFPVCVKFL